MNGRDCRILFNRIQQISRLEDAIRVEGILSPQERKRAVRAHYDLTYELPNSIKPTDLVDYQRYVLART